MAIVAIALLGALAGGCHRHTGGNQHEARAAAHCSALSYGVERFAIENNRLPATLTELTVGTDPYVDRLREDSWGNGYLLLTDGSNQYLVVSKGADGILGTTDDIFVSAGKK
jgi:hypothetical protein